MKNEKKTTEKKIVLQRETIALLTARTGVRTGAKVTGGIGPSEDSHSPGCKPTIV